MSEISRQQIQVASHARKVASAYYIYNPRVSLIDIGWQITGGEITDELAVRVHVRNKPDQAVFEAFSATNQDLVIEKDKIPFPNVDIIEANYPLQWFWFPSQPAHRRSTIFNPLLGGISVSSEWLYGYGTLGGLVEDKETGETMILSNWHVLAGSAYAPKGLSVFQPGYGDGGNYQNTIAMLERHAMNKGIDAAVAKLNELRQWSVDQLDIGPVTGSSKPSFGMRVVKSGRKSEVTQGMIDGFDGEYPIRYAGMSHTIKHVNRIIPQPGNNQVSAKGDSGSWWLEEDTHNAVALHFAGYNFPETALAISMPEVLDALNIRILTTDHETPTEASLELEVIEV